VLTARRPWGRPDGCSGRPPGRSAFRLGLTSPAGLTRLRRLPSSSPHGTGFQSRPQPEPQGATTGCPHRVGPQTITAAVHWQKEESWRGFLPHQQQHLPAQSLPPPSAADAANGPSIRPTSRADGHRLGAAPRFDLRKNSGASELSAEAQGVERSIRRPAASSTRRGHGQGKAAPGKAAAWAALAHGKKLPAGEPPGPPPAAPKDLAPPPSGARRFQHGGAKAGPPQQRPAVGRQPQLRSQ